MSTEDTLKYGAGGYVTNGPAGAVVGGVAGALGGGGHKGQSSWQSGSGLENLSPEELAVVLGRQPGQFGYDSNQAGSFESKYNEYLNSLNPDLLIKRYGSLNDRKNFATGLDQQQKQAYDTARSILGRELTGGEFAQILPAFQGPNGLTNGRAFLANLQQQYKANPMLDPGNPMNNRKPQDISNEVAGQFQSILGRAPTADELQHFSQAIQSNQTDSYGLSSFLKQQPEYTNAQDKTFRSGLNDELANYDTKVFDRQKQGVMSQFMQNVTGNSSALDSALADLMGQMAERRGNYLAGLSAAQYGGNKDLAVGNYKSTVDQMYNQSQGQNQQRSGYGQQLLNQGFQGADYQTQMNDYMRMMNGQNQSNNVLRTGDWINLGLGGANAGARMYGASRSPYSYLGG